jgi:transcription initiation factor TFIIH subunit 4
MITKDGFSFLLQDTNLQVWALLIQYLEMAEEVCKNVYADMADR